MKSKFLSVLTACVFVLTAFGAYGAEIDMETREVLVKGEADGAIEGTEYLAKVFNPDVVDNKEEVDFTDWYNYIYQGEIGADGSYEFNYILNEETPNGKYEIEIVLENGTIIDDYFYYFTKEYADEVVQDITEPEGETEADKLVNLMADLDDFDIRVCLNTDFTSYDELDDKKSAAKELMALGQLSGREEFKKVFSGISAAYRIEEADGDDVEEVLDRTAVAIGFDKLSTYKEYKALTNKVAANKFMISSGATDGDEIIERLSFYIISREVEDVENWKLVRGVLEDFNDVLNLDFTDFDESDSQYNIIEAFLDADYTDVEEIADEFEKAVEKGGKKEDDKEKVDTGRGNKHNSGGGGGGSTGSRDNTSLVKVESNGTDKPETETPEDSKIFPDVAKTYWASDYIEELYNAGVINGDKSGKFNPESSITREEFVKMFVLALNIPDSENYVAFGDVEADRWSSSYIQSAREKGLVSGTEDGKFLPEDKITRQDLFTIVGRFLADSEPFEYIPFGFADEDMAEDYAKPYIAFLANDGLIKGYEDNTVNPLGNCTRAEAAAMICRLADSVR